MTTFPTLHTPRLTLGELEVSDIPTIVKYADNPNISNMLRTMPYPYYEKDAIFWLNRARIEFEKGTAYMFRIGLTETSEFIGNIGIHIKKEHKKGIVGYWISEPFWGNGYMTEALEAMLKFGFEELNLHKISAVFQSDNPASGKVMIKNHMIKEAELVDDEFKDGKFHTLIQYRLTKPEYRQIKLGIG